MSCCVHRWEEAGIHKALICVGGDSRRQAHTCRSGSLYNVDRRPFGIRADAVRIWSQDIDVLVQEKAYGLFR